MKDAELLPSSWEWGWGLNFFHLPSSSQTCTSRLVATRHKAFVRPSTGAEEVVKILLGQRALANAVDHVGMTPLDMAMLVQNWGIKKLLEQNGVELQPILKRKAQESSWLLKAGCQSFVTIQ